MPHRRLSDYFDAGPETQSAFAARLGISKSYLSKIVAGQAAPSLAVAVRIAAAAGIPVESLLPSSPDQATAEPSSSTSTDPGEEGTNAR